jgi:hypothetical protein
MIPDFSLDKNFWRKFTKTYWNRRPTVIRAPFRKAIVTPSEVFRAVVSVRRRLRQPTDDFAFYLGQRRMVMDRDLDHWFPCEQDASIEQYLAKLKRTPARGQLTIFVSNFQVELGWSFLGRLRQFLKGFYEIEGVPSDRAEVDLFLGNYRRTAVGVHRDSADVFCFVVDGRKRIRAWPANIIRSSSPISGPVSYDEHLVKRSVCLEGEPGDIIYWPSSYWHVAESDGWFGISLSLGLYYGSAVSRALAQNLEARTREILGSRNSIVSLPFSTTRVAPDLASVAPHVEYESGRLKRELTCFWMERITSYGFARTPPPRRRVPLRTGKAVRANPALPILCRKFNQDLVISANGRSVVVPHHRELVKLIRSLACGQVCELADLLRAGRQKPPPLFRKRVLDALQFLLDERALEYA